MKRSALFVLVGLVLALSLACSAIGGGDDGGDDGGGATSSGVDIKIVNDSPDDICYVLISSSDSDEWGDDQLGEDEVIASGDSKTFNMGADTYDVQAMACDESAMATAWEISADTTVTVGDSDATVRLLLSNESSTEVCYVYVSPSTGDDWGEDWMGENETVQAGATRLFYVEPDTYDLQALDCEGNTLTEEYQVDLTEDLTWTMND